MFCLVFLSPDDADLPALKVEYDELHKCMLDVGFSMEEVDAIVGVLAAVLHIGNITFAPNDSDFAVISSPKVIDLR